MFDINCEELVDFVADGGKATKKEIDLTVAITAHKEGLLAHKTMLSVLLALKEVISCGYNVEIIIHIDNGSKSTERYFKRYEGINNISIYRNTFGDLGMSRNFAAKKAKGKYVAFIDADDLCSANYFINAIQMLEHSKEEIVVHAEAILLFGVGRENILSIQHDSNPGRSDALQLMGANKWGSEIVAKKETFAKCKYRKTENGYGYEDYMLNIELLSMGIAHKVAKGTVRFYRRTDNSLLTLENSKHTTIPYMDFFDFEEITKKPITDYSGVDNIQSVDTITKIKKNKVYRWMRDNNFLNYFITPIAAPVVKRRLKKSGAKKKLPGFVIEEWKNINRIETQLYPHPWVIDATSSYSAENKIAIGEAYYNAMKQVTKKPDYVLIVPWIIRGGGDKVILNYVKALHEIYKDWHFVVIATNPNVTSVWADRLPNCADFVELGECLKTLDGREWDNLMTPFITQLGCKRLHIINSMYGYEWAMRHKELIKENYKLNVTLFNADYIPETNQRGIFAYDDPYLSDIIDVVRRVTTDNYRMIDRMLNVDGFMDKEKFKVHYQPITEIKARQPKKKWVEDGKLHILWAGRIVPQKIPEVLIKIGKKLNPEKFVIDVYGEIGYGMNKGMFNGVDTIKHHGAFDGFDTLPIEKADLLLYTSQSDGIPNIILEATMAGLPIIASNDGGVGEVIKDGETGILVEDMLNPDAYVEKINEINDIEKLETYVKNAQELVKTRHNWDAFLKDVKRDLVENEKK